MLSLSVDSRFHSRLFATVHGGGTDELGPPRGNGYNAIHDDDDADDNDDDNDNDNDVVEDVDWAEKWEGDNEFSEDFLFDPSKQQDWSADPRDVDQFKNLWGGEHHATSPGDTAERRADEDEENDERYAHASDMWYALPLDDNPDAPADYITAGEMHRREENKSDAIYMDYNGDAYLQGVRLPYRLAQDLLDPRRPGMQLRPRARRRLEAREERLRRRKEQKHLQRKSWPRDSRGQGLTRRQLVYNTHILRCLHEIVDTPQLRHVYSHNFLVERHFVIHSVHITVGMLHADVHYTIEPETKAQRLVEVKKVVEKKFAEDLAQLESSETYGPEQRKVLIKRLHEEAEQRLSPEKKRVQRALDAMIPVYRKRLAETKSFRRVPELRFVRVDEQLEEAAKLDEALTQLIAEQQRKRGER